MLKKTLQPIAGLLVLIFILSSVVLYVVIKNFYDDEVLKRIEQTMNFEKSIHAYVSTHQKPAIYELQDKGVISHEYFDARLLSSTFIAQKIFENFENINGEDSDKMMFKIASDNPTNMKNLATSYEQGILEKFRNSGINSYQEKIEKERKTYIFYAQKAGTNEKKCMQCHGNPEDAPKEMVEKYGSEHGFFEKEGDLRAIFALYIPTQKSQNDFYMVFFSIVLLSFIVFVTIFLIIAFYAKKVLEKDALIAKQSKFAAMGEMIGMIAHQWRQPLTGIGMTVDNLKLDIELETIEPVQWSSNLDLIKSQIHYLSHTIDDFRNFFKPNQEPQEVTLVKLIDDSIQVVQGHLDKNNVRLYKLCDENIKAVTFRNDLMQVILNLVKNAADALIENEKEEPEIKIGCLKMREWIEIEVSDNAGGVPEEIIDKIFDPYFSTKDEKNGTGLGLYMSKMIVEDHLGGKLELVTDEEGSSFIIKIKDKVRSNGN